jgi:hypothetical protein
MVDFLVPRLERKSWWNRPTGYMALRIAFILLDSTFPVKIFFIRELPDKWGVSGRIHTEG